MTKAEIVENFASKTGVTKKEAARILDVWTDMFAEALRRDGKLLVPGVGSFRRVTRGARIGRNPRTGETIQIPEKKTIRFQPSKTLMDALA